MMLTQNSAKWIDLLSLCTTGDIIIPTSINKDNFVVLQSDDYGDNFNAIHKYNIYTNKWTTTKCNPIPIHSDIPTLNGKQNVLYYLIDNLTGTDLMQVELNNNKITKHILSNENSHNSNSKCIIINNELFVIGGLNSHSISKWNAKSKRFVQIGSIYHKKLLDNFGVTYENKTNSILLFGGYDTTLNYEPVDYILQYDLIAHKCDKIKVSLPKPIMHVCCLKAIHNKYVLIFGGYGVRMNFDDIYIYSIDRQTIKTSKIKCPSKGRFTGIISNDKMKDEKCVFGFVRNICKKYLIDLAKLIHTYYLNEWVYLLHYETKKHYKINTLDIV